METYVCVVYLPQGLTSSIATFMEESILELRLILCPSQSHVCTLIAVTSEISGLKYLYRKFAKLEFLPPCNVIPVMISTLNQELDLNGVPTHLKYTQTLASLTCSTGLNVNIQLMQFSYGCWDAAVRTLGQNAICLMRQKNTDILDVHGSEMTLEKSKYLTENAIDLDYWYFFVTNTHLPIARRMIFLVIPVWDSPIFHSSKLTDIITSVFYYCNTHSIKSVAFPIIGHISKKIPIPVSAQCILQAINDLSSKIRHSCLNLMDIVVTDGSYIRSFTNHFLTLIQQHLIGMKMVVTSERVEEDMEETCPICLDKLNCSGLLFRKLTSCEHEFHEKCILKVLDVNPRCPLCLFPLSILRGNQPQGGIMTNSKLSTSLLSFRNCETVEINYFIPAGVQNASHQNPGHSYPSTTRTAYLPDSAKGQRILSLLKVAFERCLIFTVALRLLCVSTM